MYFKEEYLLFSRKVFLLDKLSMFYLKIKTKYIYSF